MYNRCTLITLYYSRTVSYCTKNIFLMAKPQTNK